MWTEYSKRQAVIKTKELLDVPFIELDNDYLIPDCVFKNDLIFYVTPNSIKWLQELYEKVLSWETKAASICASVGERYRHGNKSARILKIFLEAETLLEK